MNTIQEFLSQKPVNYDISTIQYIEGLKDILEILRAVMDFDKAKRAVNLIQGYINDVKAKCSIVFEREDVTMTCILTQPMRAPMAMLTDKGVQMGSEPVVCCLIQVSFDNTEIKKSIKPLVLGLGLDVATRRLYSVGVSPSFDLSNQIRIG